jgi:hypothetical protein
VVRVEEPVAPQVVALLAGLAQALVAELDLAPALAPRVDTLRKRTLREVQAAQCQVLLAKVPTQEWAAMSAPRAPARPIPARAQPKSAGSSLERPTTRTRAALLFSSVLTVSSSGSLGVASRLAPERSEARKTSALAL